MALECNESDWDYMEKLVSIVVPVYNVEKYIGKCVDSLKKQSYKNIEIILIDDGSTDTSGKLCDIYAQQDQRIVVVHQKNKGLSGARNTALDIAQGEYITCVDSDDFIAVDFILRLVNAIDDAKADIAVCGTIYCDEKNNEIKRMVCPEVKVVSGDKQIENLLSCFDIATMAWGKLYRADLFQTIRYPEGKYNEDVFTTYKLLDKSSRTVIINSGMYYYRQVTTSIMHQSFSVKHLDAIEGTIERARFIEKQYPQYIEWAWATVGHTCCKTYERMILAGSKNKKIEKYIQKTIRKGWRPFVRLSAAALKTKLFATVCAINMSAARWMYNLLSHVR